LKIGENNNSDLTNILNYKNNRLIPENNSALARNRLPDLVKSQESKHLNDLGSGNNYLN